MAESNSGSSAGAGLISRLKAQSTAEGKKNAQKRLAELTQQYSTASSRSTSRHSKRMRRGGRADLKNLPEAIKAQEKLIESGAFKTDARMNEVIKGAQFGQEVLGPEGLGRLGTDTEVQGALQGYKNIADKGLSRGELAAERAQATRSIDSSTQTASRGLQAKLAKMGVKGSVAGQQLVQAEMQGAQQKADLSQNLFLKSEQIKREGLKDYSQRLGQVKTFDLGQSAREKDIVLQSGLGFAQMGSAESTAKYAADQSFRASVAAAKASKPSGGGTVVCTELHRQGLIPTEIWHKNVQFGFKLAKENMNKFEGYLFWGQPVANLMKKSKIATFFLAPIMKKWVNHLGGDSSFTNKLVFDILFSFSGICGKLIKETEMVPVKIKK